MRVEASFCSNGRGKRLEKRELINRQQDWASRTKVSTADGYCLTAEQNVPWLTERMRKELEEGDGKELGSEERPGKVCALHSSSALGLNVFGYWQDRDRAPLATALGLSQSISDVQFERKFATGVRPRSPNVDIVLTLNDGSIVAIESKFTEWQGTAGTKPLRDAYLPSDTKRWAQAGLLGAQRAAEGCREVPGFVRLDVSQLLKHMLGLASQERPWRLVLLWFKELGTLSEQMEREIARFQDILGPDAARFSAMTYQELWSRLQGSLDEQHGRYRTYLQDRYF
jgi:hypothetical protein